MLPQQDPALLAAARLASVPRRVNSHLLARALPSHAGWPMASSVLKVLGATALAALAILRARGDVDWPWLVALAPGMILLLAGVVMGVVVARREREQARAEASQAPFALAAVVRADASLYKGKPDTVGPALLVTPEDPAVALDADWLTSLARHLAELRRSTTDDFGRILRRSDLDQEVPVELTGGVIARVFSTTLNTADLPRRSIPSSGLLPMLKLGGHYQLVPAGAYLRG
jgi:hypothetical protein